MLTRKSSRQWPMLPRVSVVWPHFDTNWANHTCARTHTHTEHLRGKTPFPPHQSIWLGYKGHISLWSHQLHLIWARTPYRNICGEGWNKSVLGTYRIFYFHLENGGEMKQTVSINLYSTPRPTMGSQTISSTLKQFLQLTRTNHLTPTQTNRQQKQQRFHAKFVVWSYQTLQLRIVGHLIHNPYLSNLANVSSVTYTAIYKNKTNITHTMT